MARVLGIGGVFFKARDPQALTEWYQRVLGFEAQAFPGAAFPAALAGAREGAYQVWGPFAESSEYFAPSAKPFMVNLIVDDLDALLARARDEGVEPVWRSEEDPAGRFAHLIDPEGTKVELWEPKGA